MKGLLRKVRGIVGTGLLWGGLGGVVGVVTSVIGATTDPAGVGYWLSTVGVGFAGFGFLAGAGFAVTLSLLDGRRRLGELSVGRAAAWGGLAGFSLPLALVASLSGGALPILPAVGTAAVFGGVTALLGAGSVHIARSRALVESGDPDPALLEPPF
jgi:hypothetical protein